MKHNMLTIILSERISEALRWEVKNEIGKRHLLELQKIAQKLNILETSNNELEMVKIIAKHGHAVILNYGVVKGKQSGLVMLPSQITLEQFQTFEKLRIEFEDYESIISCAIFFGPLAYKGDLKQMKYEDQIQGRNLNDVESLYYEIYEQAKNLETMEKANDSIKR